MMRCRASVLSPPTPGSQYDEVYCASVSSLLLSSYSRQQHDEVSSASVLSLLLSPYSRQQYDEVSSASVLSLLLSPTPCSSMMRCLVPVSRVCC